MRRTIKHPNGREEVQEGTPEEFAAFDHAAHEQGLSEETRRKLQEGIDATRAGRVSPFNPLFPDWMAPVQLTEQPCMFDGLPDGVYHLACPCPRHGTYC